MTTAEQAKTVKRIQDILANEIGDTSDLNEVTWGDIDINKIARCGRIWRKGDNCRVYFNDIEDYLDADVTYTRSGRLRSVEINGEEIENPYDINCVGYFDAKDSSFYWEGGAEWVHEAVKKEVLARAAAL